jgi:hypothetical protein
VWMGGDLMERRYLLAIRLRDACFHIHN